MPGAAKFGARRKMLSGELRPGSKWGGDLRPGKKWGEI